MQTVSRTTYKRVLLTPAWKVKESATSPGQGLAHARGVGGRSWSNVYLSCSNIINSCFIAMRLSIPVSKRSTYKLNPKSLSDGFWCMVFLVLPLPTALSPPVSTVTCSTFRPHWTLYILLSNRVCVFFSSNKCIAFRFTVRFLFCIYVSFHLPGLPMHSASIFRR